MANGSGFWRDYVLEAAPEAAYFSAEPFGTGFAPAEQRYWQGQYGNVMNQYLGSLGKSFRKGEEPATTSFADFLTEYPFTDRYTAMSPQLRPGGGSSRFAPSVRRFF